MSNRDNIENYISKSLIEQNASSRERFLFNSIPVIIKDFPIFEIDLSRVLRTLEQKIPVGFFREVDIVYIGDFEIFTEKEVEAVYEDGAIYVFNGQQTEEDYIESIGHEIAHATEALAPEEIYGDSSLELEFLGKRSRLKSILLAHGFEYEGSYFDTEYSEAFDMFLYKTVGYPVMSTLTSGLFMSPYAATSLREYFANGFEWFYLKNEKRFLKEISPQLYNKLDILQTI